MYKIYCDETWTATYTKCNFPCIVFYGVMIEGNEEQSILLQIEHFKKSRGLLINDNYIEIKWDKAEEEWKNSIKRRTRSRYEEFLDIFFDGIRCNKISFACMYLDKSEYDRVEKEFLAQHPENKHNFFFMLYFQFLYHTFIKHQLKQKPCQIIIDAHDLGSEGKSYDISTLKKVLNWKIHGETAPRYQLSLSPELRKQFTESITLVNLADSKEFPLIQLSDLSAGCVRYIVENKMCHPNDQNQPSLFDQDCLSDEPLSGKDELVKYFYRQIRSIKGYEKLDLLESSYHHRFCVFHFQFPAWKSGNKFKNSTSGR